MAKKRKKLKIIKVSLPVFILFLIVSLAIGFSSGLLTTVVKGKAKRKNLVWAVDKTVTVPRDLESFLLDQDKCHEYIGKGSPTGIGLWAVLQTSDNKIAKIAYGCSTNISDFTIAIKEKSRWHLIPPDEYYLSSKSEQRSVLPACTIIDKYRISKKVEPFCVEKNGAAREVTY